MADISKYLTDDEITEYCDMLPVTSAQVIFASGIIDAFVGTIKGESKFKVREVAEKHVRPNRHGVIKLKYSPVVSVEKISMCVPNSFAYISEVSADPEDFLIEDDGYIQMPVFQSCPITSNNLHGNSPIALNINYTYGYEEIPSKIKLACAMLAMNIAQQGGFANINSATNLDARYSLSDPSVFTDDIRRMLMEYR